MAKKAVVKKTKVSKKKIKAAKRLPWRPSLYKKEYCQQFIEFHGAGNTVEMFAKNIGVAKDTLYEWRKVHPDFSVAFDIARTFSIANWHTFSIEKIKEKHSSLTGAQVGLFKFMMQAMFGWTDKEKEENDPNKKTHEDWVKDMK